MRIDGSRVAVIGGAGFLGSHIVNYLIEDKGCKVIVLDNLITGKIGFVHKKADFYWCDISLSEGRIYKALKSYQVDYVFNYAAMPYIPVSFERPLHVFETNARGALMAMNAAQDAGTKGFLQISSAEIYGDMDGKINEEAPTNPHSSYGASKLAIDCLVRARWKESRTPAIALRQFNCVGERETHPYVIPEIISQLSESNEVSLGNDSFRDFLYAGDQAIMATELLEKGQAGEVYNLGSETGIKIYQLAKMIAEMMGYDTVGIKSDPARMRPWEIWHLQSDNSKIYSVINSRPQVDLRQALKVTIAYYKNEGGWCFDSGLQSRI